MGDWRGKLKKKKRTLAGEKQESGAAPREQGKPAVAPTGPAQRPVVPPRYICLGLDFGTSSTKAVARLLQTGPAHAIPFDGISSADQPYLAPTRLGVTSEGELRIAAPNGGGGVEDLKVKLMIAPWDAAPTYEGAALWARPADLAAGYLALILQKAIAWCDATIRPTLGQADVIWSLNVGIPARDFDATAIKEGFLT